jgi:hypothetical protein
VIQNGGLYEDDKQKYWMCSMDEINPMDRQVFYFDRIVGGDRDNRDSREHVASGVESGAERGEGDSLRIKSQTGGDERTFLCERYDGVAPLFRDHIQENL